MNSKECAKSSIRQIEDLGRNKGASIHRSKALFKIEGNEIDDSVINISFEPRNYSEISNNVPKMLLQALIHLCADMNAPDEKGNCPIHVAALAMNSKCIQHLISHGATLTYKNKDGVRNGWD